MTQLPFLILQLRPEDNTSDDEYRAILEHGELRAEETIRHRIEKKGIPPIDLNQFSAVIVGGSPFDVSTPANEKSDIQNKIESDFDDLFHRVVKTDFPFLGACSGNGHLGNWCGATISKTYGEPVGGIDLQLTKDGLNDPLLAGFPPTFRVLVGHKEACDDPPPGSTLLASGSACKVQMFRVKQNIYATQFHPEGDAAGFTLRIETYRHNGYFAPDEARKLITTIQAEQTPWPQKLLRRFVQRYRRNYTSCGQ